VTRTNSLRIVRRRCASSRTTQLTHVYRPCTPDWFLNQVALVSGSTVTGPPVTSLPSNADGGSHFTMPGSTWSANQTIRQGNLAVATTYVHACAVPGYSDLYDLQYWFFYAVRGFSTLRIQAGSSESDVDLEVPSSVPQQAYQGLGEHQGDWKHVTVRIDCNGDIKAVFYAQHTTGVWCFPGDFQTVTDSDGNMHPVVYSARNTHSCLPAAGRFDQIETLHEFPFFSFSLLETAADKGQYWNTWESYVDADNNPPWWISYAGQWGPTEDQLDLVSNILTVVLVPFNFVSVPLVSLIVNHYVRYDQSGPSTPTYQEPPWTTGDGWYTWTTVSPQTAWSSGGAPVTAMNEPVNSLNRLDLFICGDENGSVYNIGRAEGVGWDSSWLAVQSESAWSLGGGQVTALYRPSAQPAQMDLFIYGRNGVVYTTTRVAGAGWDTAWTPVGAPWYGAAGHHMPISGVYQPGATPDRLDLFCSDNDGHVHTIGWTAGSGWDSSGWTDVRSGSGYTTAGGPVAAVWTPTGDRLILLMCGQGGQVYTISKTPGADWDATWSQLVGLTTPGGAPVAAAFRPNAQPATLSVFAGDTNGQVNEIGWDANNGWQQTWTEISCESFPGGPIAALPLHITATWRDPDHLDLFCAGALTGRVFTNGWSSAAGSWGGWSMVSSSTGWTNFASPITAVPPDPAALSVDNAFFDLFMCGQNGVVFRTRYIPYIG
jgi:hypothetical protein